MAGAKAQPAPAPPPEIIEEVVEEEEEEEKPFLLMLCDAKRRRLMFRVVYKLLADSPVIRHLVWLMFLMIYSLAGGYMFAAIEGAHDKTEQLRDYKSKWQEDLIYRLRQIEDDKTYTVMDKTIEAHKMELLLELVDWYDAQMGIKMEPPEEGFTKWDILGGIHYAMSIYTTIGYGDLYPKTTAGRIATIVYALMGVPIMVVVMGDLGNMLYVSFQFVWIKFVKRFRVFMQKANVIEEKTLLTKRRSSEVSIRSQTIPITPDGVIVIPPMIDTVVNGQINGTKPPEPPKPEPPKQEAAAMTKQALEEAKYEEQAVLNLPIWVALLILIGWVTFSSSMVSLWEPEWSYFEAIYFYITSLTTIGLGDIVPSTPYKFILPHLATLLVGLSMMSMFVNIFNANVGLLYDRLLSLVDKEYRTIQVEPEFSLMTSAASTRAAREGLSRLYESRPLSDRLMYYLMGEHRQRLLEDRWMKRSNMINVRMQTTPMVVDKAIQTGMKSAEEKKKRGSDEEDEEDEAKKYRKGKQPKKPQNLKEKYIYHIWD